jgi:hypothetical protein
VINYVSIADSYGIIFLLNEDYEYLYSEAPEKIKLHGEAPPVVMLFEDSRNEITSHVLIGINGENCHKESNTCYYKVI